MVNIQFICKCKLNMYRQVDTYVYIGRQSHGALKDDGTIRPTLSGTVPVHYPRTGKNGHFQFEIRQNIA